MKPPGTAADVEWAARVLARCEGLTLPPRSECSPDEIAALELYEGVTRPAVDRLATRGTTLTATHLLAEIARSPAHDLARVPGETSSSLLDLRTATAAERQPCVHGAPEGEPGPGENRSINPRDEREQ